MKKFIKINLMLCSVFSFSQTPLSKMLKKYNDNSIPYIYANELSPSTSLILDTRELEEYEVSHLKDAVFVSFENFNIEDFKQNYPNKNENIVVYCSLGVRSEIIGKKLKNANYINVKNLYGGIFEWKNNDFEVYNTQKQITDSVHAFSMDWSKWLKKGIKVYSKPENNDR